MDENLKKKLNGLLKSNKDWPIIIEGDIKEEDFLNATFLPAKTPSAKLGIINDAKGLIKPNWVKSLDAKRDEKVNLLVISGLDKISMDEQVKFSAILDTKALNGYKLPQNLQIVILINKGNRAKINNEILSLCLYYTA